MSGGRGKGARVSAVLWHERYLEDRDALILLDASLRTLWLGVTGKSTWRMPARVWIGGEEAGDTELQLRQVDWSVPRKDCEAVLPGERVLDTMVRAASAGGFLEIGVSGAEAEMVGRFATEGVGTVVA